MPTTNYLKENYKSLGLRLDRMGMFDNLMENFIKAGQRQAIIFKVTKNGHSVFEGTYGTNAKANGLAMDTIFNVCSITKPVIAALILCLQEDGIVDITEPVWKYLPEFTGGGYENIHIWHFLTHTSGIKEEELYKDTESYIKNDLKLTYPDEKSTAKDWDNFHELLKEKLEIKNGTKGRMADPNYLISLKIPMKYKPRSHMTYCSYGFNRLKDIIEVASGENIDDYAKKRLFEPLNMNDTVWKMPKVKWDRIIGRVDSAVSADWFNSERNYMSESGSGGLKTTVNDMLRFANMILKGGILEGIRVLSEASIRQMFINYNKGILSNGDLDYANWSIGWNLHGNKIDDMGVLRSAQTIDHTGYGGTKLFIDPEHDLAYACFAAETLIYTNPDFMNINGRITNLLASAIENF